jgi:hypothetical protein
MVKEDLNAPKEGIKQESLIIGSIEVIENQARPTVQKVEQSNAASKDKVESSKLESKYFQPRWCPLGLTKTQRCKLQRACCKKLKKACVTVDIHISPLEQMVDICITLGTKMADVYIVLKCKVADGMGIVAIRALYVFRFA